MYVSNLSTYNRSDPYYQLCSVSVLRSSSILHESGEQEEESEQDGDNTQDYTVYLDDISSNTDLLVTQNESVLLDIDNLNNNLVTLHNDLKIGIGFGFVLMVYIIIKIAFGIFNKVFAVDKW